MPTEKTVTLRVGGTSPDALTWSEYSLLVDVLIGAIEAFAPAGALGAGAYPRRVSEGSLRIALPLSRPARAGLEVLRAGRTDTWTPPQTAAARRLHKRLAEKRLTVAVERRAGVVAPFQPVTVPNWEVVELCSFEAVVRWVGGDEGGVGLRSDRFGLVRTHVGRDLAEELGALLYRPILVDAVRTSDARTGMTLDLKVQRFSRLPPGTSIPMGIAALRELLGEDVSDVSVDEVLLELRG